MALKDAFTRINGEAAQLDRDRDTLTVLVGQTVPGVVADGMRTILALVDRQGTAALLAGRSPEQVQAIAALYTLMRTAMIAWDSANVAIPEFAALPNEPTPAPEPEPEPVPE